MGNIVVNFAFYWLVFGFLLMFFELIVPGFVAIFLSLGALVVSGTLYFQWILDSWYSMFLMWIFSSMILTFLFRPLFTKLLKPDVAIGQPDELEDPTGRIVLVVKNISSDNELGRIEFRGTTWSAKSEGDEIKAGSKVKLLKEEDQIWIVSKVD